MLLVEPWVHNGTQKNVWECCVFTICLTSSFSSKLGILKNNEICIPCYPVLPPHTLCMCEFLSPSLRCVFTFQFTEIVKYLPTAELVNDYLDMQDWKCWASHTGSCCRETNSDGLCCSWHLVNTVLTSLTLHRLESKLKENQMYALISIN